MKVLFLTNIPSPYRVAFFNELGKQCDLTVLFERESSTERDDSWKKFAVSHFKAVFLPGFKMGVASAFCPSVTRYLKKQYDRIIVTNFSDLTGIWAIRYLKKHKIPYALESDGAFPGSGKGVKEWIKRKIIEGADQYFSTAVIHDQYYRTYGATDEQIVRYPFSSIMNDDVLNNVPSISEKKKIRTRLQMIESKILLSVGRFSYNGGYGKGYDVLLKVAERLGNEFGIYIVGDEPTEEFVQLRNSKGLHNVHFIGFKNKAELTEYYAASDCFVLLTRGDCWGLVINEAMANGLPIVTTPMCIAGTELVTDNENGFLVQLDSEELIAQKIREIVSDESKNQSFSQASLQKVSKYTIENMATAHMNIFLETKSEDQ